MAPPTATAPQSPASGIPQGPLPIPPSTKQTPLDPNAQTEKEFFAYVNTQNNELTDKITNNQKIYLSFKRQ